MYKGTSTEKQKSFHFFLAYFLVSAGSMPSFPYVLRNGPFLVFSESPPYSPNRMFHASQEVMASYQKALSKVSFEDPGSAPRFCCSSSVPVITTPYLLAQACFLWNIQCLREQVATPRHLGQASSPAHRLPSPDLSRQWPFRPGVWEAEEPEKQLGLFFKEWMC